ncbi:sensor histidine kinase [Microlunatus sp. Y2014]|uniref:sensor histidine kinase n=1 Tax=Microlunatus sp. Y2014 TaxID=3418488 RepID=UPI003DA754AF
MPDPDGVSHEQPAEAEDWPNVSVRPEERRPVLVMTGMWLIFLLWPLTSILLNLNELPAAERMIFQVLGVVGLIAFVVVYLWGFLNPWPVRALPRWSNMVAVTVVLAGCIALVHPAGGVAAWTCLPFLLAPWIMMQPPRVGIPVALLIMGVGMTVAIMIDGVGRTVWVILPAGLSFVLLLGTRYVQSREERAAQLQQELSLSRQREQFGRDMHDVLGHSLTVVAVKTELAHRLVDVDPEGAKAELSDVLALARQSLGEVRATVGGLQAPKLSGQLAAAHQALDAAGITAQLPGPDEAAEIPAVQQDVFAWCLREAITNVVRHAQAERCTVTVVPGRLTVSDDGIGISNTATGQPTPGHGLAGLRNRVVEAGGTVVITDTEPGRDRPGTTLEVRL